MKSKVVLVELKMVVELEAPVVFGEKQAVVKPILNPQSLPMNHTRTTTAKPKSGATAG